MIIMMVVVGEEALVGQEGSERDHLHHRLPLALAEQHRLVVAQGDSPDGLAWLREFANEGAGLEVPELDAAIVTAGDDEAVVELETGDRVIVGAEAMDALERVEREDDHAAVRAARDEHVGLPVDLYLSHQRRVSLEQRQELPRNRRPDTPCTLR